MTTLWDTTGTQVVKTLAQVRRTGSSVTSGLALTLVVVVDEEHVAEAEEAATVAASAHPCRIIIVIRRGYTLPQNRLDAEVSVGERFGATEAIVMHMYGRLSLHAESVVLPLLAPDVPVVTWWYGAPPNVIAEDPLGVLAERRITDCSQADDPHAALEQRAVDYAPGDTDLAWTRTTPWRSLLASAFDTTEAVAERITLIAPSESLVSRLAGGWLHTRLGVIPEFVSVERTQNAIEAVQIAFSDETELNISWHNSHTAVIRSHDVPDRLMPLRQRTLGERLAEELRHLDPDQSYAAALAAATGVYVADLHARSPMRVHRWRDPALADT